MKVKLFITLLTVATISAGTIPKDDNDNAAAISDLHEKRMHPDNDRLQPKPANYRQQRSEEQNSFWLNNAKDFVAKQRERKQNQKVAKNIIMFLGDGMSTATTTATRAYLGGEEKSLSFEEFPAVGMAKTYCVSNQVSDSASTSTAYLSGVKANYGTIGVTAKVPRYDCTAQLDPSTHTASIAKWAMDAGKVAGFVTTSEITDASPAGLYAHSANRYWENDGDILDRGCDPTVLDDIARQLIHGDLGSKLRVIMGGGRQQFRATEHVDEEGRAGLRRDGRDLIAEWKSLKQNEKAAYIWNTVDLLNINATETDYLFGVFEYTDMRYNLEVLAEQIQDKEPTLSQMTEKAIDILSKNEEGFFLFVEGGKIDSAHHGTYARLALDETAELAKAVALARSKLSEDDTLIVVTADHSHTMTISGYPYRYNDIFGNAGMSYEDNKSYMTLSYANGRGYENHMSEAGRIDPDTLNKSSVRFRFPTGVPLSSETHAGDDVAVYASGPWAHLFTGNYEQNVIPVMMGYASCIGESTFLKACN